MLSATARPEAMQSEFQPRGTGAGQMETRMLHEHVGDAFDPLPVPQSVLRHASGPAGYAIEQGRFADSRDPAQFLHREIQQHFVSAWTTSSAPARPMKHRASTRPAVRAPRTCSRSRCKRPAVHPRPLGSGSHSLAARWKGHHGKARDTVAVETNGMVRSAALRSGLSDSRTTALACAGVASTTVSASIVRPSASSTQ